MNNARRLCCERAVRSSYNVTTIERAQADGARFAWRRAVRVESSEGFNFGLRGSGGNALHTALALCQSIDVYGAGLFSDRVGDDLIYAHYYDHEGVAQCQKDPGATQRASKLTSFGGFILSHPACTGTHPVASLISELRKTRTGHQSQRRGGYGCVSAGAARG